MVYLCMKKSCGSRKSNVFQTKEMLVLAKQQPSKDSTWLCFDCRCAMNHTFVSVCSCVVCLPLPHLYGFSSSLPSALDHLPAAFNLPAKKCRQTSPILQAGKSWWRFCRQERLEAIEAANWQFAARGVQTKGGQGLVRPPPTLVFTFIMGSNKPRGCVITLLSLFRAFIACP